MNLLVTEETAPQPPLMTFCNELNVAISSLSIGGAERIVLDWKNRINSGFKVRLIVLRNRDKEWPLPSNLEVIRLEDPSRIKALDLRGSVHENRLAQLRLFGKEIAASSNPTCVCHLLNKEERDALSESGVNVVNVLHNAKDGGGNFGGAGAGGSFTTPDDDQQQQQSSPQDDSTLPVINNPYAQEETTPQAADPVDTTPQQDPEDRAPIQQEPDAGAQTSY